MPISSKTIFHIDADSFFASVERAMHPEWGNIPVCVTALQGGCILACTYEMKKLGVKTGMPVWEAKKLLRGMVFRECRANFAAYARYAENMFSIFREFTPDVEEYSIDEAFLDMTGLRSLYRVSYEGIAKLIQDRVFRELGLPVTVGIACTKILAKMASKRGKPHGIFRIRKKQIPSFISQATFEDVPGIGFNSEALLRKFRIQTVEQFVHTDEQRVQTLLHKPGVLTWKELRGESCLPFVVEEALPKSISRIRSFSLTTNYSFLEVQLIQHLVLCCEKLRRKGLLVGHLTVGVRDHEYVFYGKEYLFDEPHASTLECIRRAVADFPGIVSSHNVRSVYICFSRLVTSTDRYQSLFGETDILFREEDIFHALDRINGKFGQGTVRPARISMVAAIPLGAPGDLSYPYLGEVG